MATIRTAPNQTLTRPAAMRWFTGRVLPIDTGVPLRRPHDREPEQGLAETTRGVRLRPASAPEPTGPAASGACLLLGGLRQQPVPEPGHLHLQRGPVARIVEDEVGLLAALLPRDLRADARLGVGAVEAPLAEQPLERDIGRAVDHHHLVEPHRLAVQGRQQRDGQHHDVVGPLVGITRRDHGETDGRVRDGIELQPTVLVGEGQGGQRGTVDGAVGGDDPGPEPVDQRLVGRSAGSHHVSCHLVGVDEDRPACHEEVGHGGLARADAARQPDRQHQVVTRAEALASRRSALRLDPSRRSAARPRRRAAGWCRRHRPSRTSRRP